MENLILLSKFSLLSGELQAELLDFLDYLNQKQQKIQQTKATQKPLNFWGIGG
jgi:hypothetical protein